MPLCFFVVSECPAQCTAYSKHSRAIPQVAKLCLRSSDLPVGSETGISGPCPLEHLSTQHAGRTSPRGRTLYWSRTTRDRTAAWRRHHTPEHRQPPAAMAWPGPGAERLPGPSSSGPGVRVGPAAPSHIPWDSPGKSAGVGCHALLQGNLSNPLVKPRFPASLLPTRPTVFVAGMWSCALKHASVCL